jgi:RHS repeat-associated protein
LRAGVRLEDATFAYDRLGQWTSMTRFLNPANSTGAVTLSRRVDSLGNPLQLSEPGTARRTFSYSDWNELIATDWVDGGASRSIISTFDALSRITSQKGSTNGIVDAATVKAFAYDVPASLSPLVTPTFVQGQLARADSVMGSVAFSYDALGRRNASTYTDLHGGIYNEKEEYHADGSLKLLTFLLPDNNYAPESFEYGYDSNDQLRTITPEGAATGALYSAQNIDPFGRVTSASHGKTEFYAEFAADGRRLMKQASIQSPLDSRQVTFGLFDPMDRELSRQESSINSTVPSRTELSYDVFGRLATARDAIGPTRHFDWNFTYDPLGNIYKLSDNISANNANLSYQNDDKDRICRISYGGEEFGFDLLGGHRPWLPYFCNVVHDDSGDIVNEPTRTGSRQITYFVSGNVSSIVQDKKQANFNYDAFGEIQTLDIQNNGQSVLHHQHYGEWIERRDSQSQGGTVSIITRNIPGPGGIIASRRGPSGDQVFEFGELRGNRYFVNQDGTIVQDVNYQPFGETQSIGATPGTADYSSALWNGGDDLAEFGLSHLGARLYDPVIGRFLSRDPLLIPRTALSTNPYAFSNNDPWNSSDPSGLDCIEGECDDEPTLSTWGFFADAGSLASGRGKATQPAPQVSAGPEPFFTPSNGFADSVSFGARGPNANSRYATLGDDQSWVKAQLDQGRGCVVCHVTTAVWNTLGPKAINPANGLPYDWAIDQEGFHD